jgi:hypothetical protein
MCAEKTIADLSPREVVPHSLCLRPGSRPYADYAAVRGQGEGEDDNPRFENAAPVSQL